MWPQLRSVPTCPAAHSAILKPPSSVIRPQNLDPGSAVRRPIGSFVRLEPILPPRPCERLGAVYSDAAVRPAANVAISHRFKLDGEALPAFWMDLQAELERVVAPRALPEVVLNALHKMFLRVLLNLGEHVFEAVTLPAVGAEHSVLGVRISGACKGLMARCALDLLDITGHGSTPATVLGGAKTIAESQACR